MESTVVTPHVVLWMEQSIMAQCSLVHLKMYGKKEWMQMMLCENKTLLFKALSLYSMFDGSRQGFLGDVGGEKFFCLLAHVGKKTQKSVFFLSGPISSCRRTRRT